MVENAEGISPARAWYAVILLTLLYSLSFVDRLILAYLADPISREMNLTDSQIGLLVGFGFAVVYGIAGMPLGHLLDTRMRTRIVAGGVIVWSAMTIAAGFAETYLMLAVTRAGVAVGEAVLTPAAVSLIGDMFPRERRAAPISVYGSVAAFMSFGSFVVGAAALDLAQEISGPLEMVPWRITFVILGVPGLLLGLLFLLTVREPPRSRASEARPKAGAREFFAYLTDRRYILIPLIIGASTISAFAFAKVTWLPALLTRGYDVSMTTAGYFIGATGVVAGVAGAVIWPNLAQWLSNRFGFDHPTHICLLLATILVLPLIIFVPMTDDSTVLVIGLAVSTTFLGSAPILSQYYAQTKVHPEMRARFMAVVLLGINIVGFGGGSLFLPMIADIWPENSRALGQAMTVMALATGGITMFCYATSWIAARRRTVTNPEESVG